MVAPIKPTFSWTRVLLVAALVWFAQTLTESAAIVFGADSVPFLVAPAAVLYAVLHLSFVEASVASTLAGFIIDAMTGYPLGVHMVLFLGLWLACATLVAWLGRPQQWVIFFVLMVISLCYRILFFWIAKTVMHVYANWDLWSLTAGPVIDAIVGSFMIRLMHRVFVTLRLSDPLDDMMVRLSRRI